MHDRFHVEQWFDVFSVDKVDDFLHGPTITGPGEVAIVEQIKRRAIIKRQLFGTPIPIDLCVCNWGESPRRETTHVGGLPYRPAIAPWPKDAAGDALTFVAQFSFCVSKDLRNPLPGDVLLIFGPNENDFE
jgi:hypothetical protein